LTQPSFPALTLALPLPQTRRVSLPGFRDAAAVEAALEKVNYLPDPGLATAVFLGLRLHRPLFLEGEPGVGKTALAQKLATALEATYVRLQCYSGIDASRALYDWDFPRQILALRAVADPEGDVGKVRSVYHPDFLLERPILRAIRHSGSVVLLIDEIDRADDEFEAFLLEVLERGGISIPELGESDLITADLIVVLTSNRTREVHDALKRRCMYHWIEHPSVEQETKILRALRPDVSPVMAAEVAQLMHRLRSVDGMIKRPGVSETLDLVDSVRALGADELTPDVVQRALGAVVKHRDDQDVARQAIAAGSGGLGWRADGEC
jgi:MoxR-like ATPase